MKKIITVFFIAILLILPFSSMQAAVEKQNIFQKFWSHVPIIGSSTLEEYESPLGNGDFIKFSKKESLAIVSMEPKAAVKYVDSRNKIEAAAVFIDDILKQGAAELSEIENRPVASEARQVKEVDVEGIINACFQKFGGVPVVKDNSAEISSVVVVGACVLFGSTVLLSVICMGLLYLVVKSKMDIRDVKHQAEVDVLTKEVELNE